MNTKTPLLFTESKLLSGTILQDLQVWFHGFIGSISTLNINHVFFLYPLYTIQIYRYKPSVLSERCCHGTDGGAFARAAGLLNAKTTWANGVKGISTKCNTMWNTSHIHTHTLSVYIYSVTCLGPVNCCRYFQNMQNYFSNMHNCVYNM